MYEILPMKGYDEKDFGTLKILKDHPYGDEYKKEIIAIINKKIRLTSNII